MQTITDPSRIQEIRNSIAEGQNLLRSGLNVLGKPLTSDERGLIRKTVSNDLAKIGENLIINNRDKGYTLEDVTPEGFGI